MRETFQYHQQILHHPQHSVDVLQMFPCFLDTKGLILQDFSLMFGEEAASRFLQKWNTSFKDKVIQEAKNLKETSLLKRHLTSALNEGSDTTDDPDTSSKSNKISRMQKDFIDYFPEEQTVLLND
ncbi:hypothetical protein LDENG_00294160 [Lucifuga dentata]|nr:hypothetical protein LDENG_00294160 [Lucifuga dentata]